MENEARSGKLTGWQLGVIALAAVLLAWIGCCIGLAVGGVTGYRLGQSRSGAISTPEWRIIPVPEFPTPTIPPTERPYLGIRFVMRENGAEIQEVIPDSPADKAGLQVGDIIRQVDGQRVRLPRSLTDILLTYRPGDRVVLTVEREGKELGIPVTLGRRSSP